MTYKPKMRDHADAKRVFRKAEWDSSFQLLGKLTYLLLEKEGCGPHQLLIPDNSYATHRLPASFFLAAFEQVGIVNFSGYTPVLYDLMENWGFYGVKRHLEKQHPTKPDCRVVLHLDAGIGEPYLLLIEDSGRKTLLFGQPKSILHFLDALEVNGFFEPDEPMDVVEAA